MIPDVTPNGVFYLPPTGWLTSFYNPPISVNPDMVKETKQNVARIEQRIILDNATGKGRQAVENYAW